MAEPRTDRERMRGISITNGGPTNGRKALRKFVKAGLVVAFILMLPTIHIIVWRTWFSHHAEKRPMGLPSAAIPESQTEGHTCAVHSLRAIYRAYGLDPGEENLRFRLGTDFYSLVWMRDSTGTLHPDIHMVLTQDGFQYQTVNPRSESDRKDVMEHLASGHLAMALIRRRQNQNLHWVVLELNRNGEVRVADSLVSEPYPEGGEEFWKSVVISTIMVKPRADRRAGSAIWGHLSGAWHTLTMVPRMLDALWPFVVALAILLATLLALGLKLAAALKRSGKVWRRSVS